MIKENLQGRVQVPTGGKARERESVDPVILYENSGADSIVWMEEESIWKA